MNKQSSNRTTTQSKHKNIMALSKKVIFLFMILFLNHLNVFSQNEAITGTITDLKTKETIVGATVMLEGTTTGVSSDLDGNFKISPLKPGSYNIIISYISCKRQVIQFFNIYEAKHSYCCHDVVIGF